MQRVGYKILGVISCLLALATGFIYIPISLNLFNVNSAKWLDLTKDILKSYYSDVIIYVGLAILIAIVVLNLVSLVYKTNMAKICFKLTTIISLILPIMFVCTMQFDWAFKFWINNIAKNIKMISYIVMSVSAGLFILGIIFNITSRKRANFHHVFEALAMLGLFIVMICAFDWCGWTSNIHNFSTLIGVMVLWLSAYLLISTIVLFACSKSYKD